MLAGGTALNLYGTHRAQKAQERELWRGIEEEGKIGKRANERTLGYARERFDPQKRLAEYQAGSQPAPQAEVNITSHGGGSSAYQQALQAAEQQSAGRVNDYASAHARAGGIGALNFGDALAGKNLGADMLMLQSEAERARRVAELRRVSASRKGQGWRLAGGLLSGAGSAMGGGS
jgi:hypothetical protein